MSHGRAGDASGCIHAATPLYRDNGGMTQGAASQRIELVYFLPSPSKSSGQSAIASTVAHCNILLYSSHFCNATVRQ